MRLYIDATVRSPLAARYLLGRPSSAAVDGVAGRKGEEEKQVRYPPRDGVRCTTAAVERMATPTPFTAPSITRSSKRVIASKLDRPGPPTKPEIVLSSRHASARIGRSNTMGLTRSRR